MDSEDIEGLHSLLQEVGLPSSIQGLRNPTEEFVISIIYEFFRNNYIDVNEIKRLNETQLVALHLTDPENAWITQTLNTYESITAIGQKMFMQDLNIIDLTFPIPKKIRRNLKLIANFALYARNKEGAIQPKVDDVYQRSQRIHELNKQREEMILAMNTKAAEIARIKDEMERMKIEMLQITARKMKNNEKIAKMAERRKNREEKLLNLNQQKQSLIIKVQKKQEKNENLQTKVVNSPEKYDDKLRELEEERENKQKEKETINEAIRTKNPIIRRLENSLNFVQRVHEKLAEFNESHLNLSKIRKENEDLERIIQEKLREINFEENFEKKMSNGKNENFDKKKCEDEIAEKLAKMKSSLALLIKEKKIADEKREILAVKKIATFSEIEQIKNQIDRVNEKCDEFEKYSQDLYNSEIQKMREIEENLEKRK